MKDAKGHGSNKRPIPGHPYHSKTNAELQYIVRDAAEAREAMRGHSPEAENKYADQVNDASTVLGYRARGGKSDAPADALAGGGAKSSPVPVHDSMNAKRVQSALDSMSRLSTTFRQGDNRYGEYGKNTREAHDRHAKLYTELTGKKAPSIYG